MGRRVSGYLGTEKGMDAYRFYFCRGKLITFKDRPQSHFKRLSLPEIHQVRSRFRSHHAY